MVSIIWTFFERLTDKVKCKICHKNFENISIISQYIDKKTVFGDHLEFV